MQTGVKYALQNSNTNNPISSPPAISELKTQSIGIKAQIIPKTPWTNRSTFNHLSVFILTLIVNAMKNVIVT